MKDKPYFMALPEMVRVEMKTVISVLTAHFFCPERLYLAGIPACADSGSDYKAGSDFCETGAEQWSELTEKFQW
ncbi:hypothetical protein [Klebsiella quasipneumoniae]|uniref:hypothetical protein n=1 Tax=Klebsiella quasipneumoniae TaxID=1463165 RepID=UPI00388F2839